MSDVSVAPAPSAPAMPANQVAVDPNPVQPPQPVSQQNITAPDPGRAREDGRERPGHSISDAVERAFARGRGEVNTQRPKQQEARESRPGPAKAEMGHNRPPEETKPERREPKANSQRETLNLKKRPDDQTPPPATSKAQDKERARGEHGHFAPAQLQGQQSSQQPVQQLPEGVPYRQPPRGMSPQVARDWAKTPESVRADLHRISQTVGRHNQAFAVDREIANSVRHYHQMAQQHGTTLARALENYTGMEQLLRSDPLRAFDVITNNLNLRSQDGQKLNFGDLAWYYLNQTPDQRRMVQQQNLATAQHHQLQQIQQNQAILAQQHQQMQYEREFAGKRHEVDRFAESHPRLDELGADIHRELRFGFDLPTAYRRAELLRPASGNGQTTDRAPAQAGSPTRNPRNSDRSISGAPDTALNGTARRKPSATVHDAVAKAAARVGL
jgi:hypothetical protein